MSFLRENSCDILIVGAGIIGLTVARELSRRGIKNIVVLEKEETLGVHASGRNSGVLHAGLYYSTDSLKARFCSRGAALLKTYVGEKQLRFVPSGKVLVASRESQLGELEKIYARSLENKIRVEKINIQRLSQIEPTAKTTTWALYSPDTAVIQPKEILQALRADLGSSGVEICTSEPAISIETGTKTLRTPRMTWHYGHLVNAAGLHADRLAHMMGAGLHYEILPFRGRYQKLVKSASERIKGLIYPIPNPDLPFLGVHLTKSVTGDVWVGPTAEPALGRDNYKGLGGIVWKEFPRLSSDLLSMILMNAGGLASHIREEIKKQLPGGLLRAAQELVPELSASDFSGETKTGLRAQLIDRSKKQFVMDFVTEAGPDSTHILNAVSPGFTASFAFAEYIADRVSK